MRANANKRRQTLTNASKRKQTQRRKRKQTRANVDKRKQTLTPPLLRVFYTPLCNPPNVETLRFLFIPRPPKCRDFPRFFCSHLLAIFLQLWQDNLAMRFLICDLKMQRSFCDCDFILTSNSVSTFSKLKRFRDAKDPNLYLYVATLRI